MAKKSVSSGKLAVAVPREGGYGGFGNTAFIIFSASLKQNCAKPIASCRVAGKEPTFTPSSVIEKEGNPCDDI